MWKIIFFGKCLILSCTTSKQENLILKKVNTNESQYNGYLINRDPGLHKLEGYSIIDSSFGIILVHGYYPSTWETKGYEWNKAIHQTADLGRPIWWLRYRWFDCPEKSVAMLSNSINNLIEQKTHLDSLWIIGHSLGGFIVSHFAENWEKNFPITIHAIASPLKEINRKSKKCILNGKSNYIFNNSINYNQWRTQYKQDGAFKHLDKDPQDVILHNGNYIILPKEWDGKRIGHNYSIQWVLFNIKNNIKPYAF
ncbi:MAG: hypothetical protein CMG55_07195 [Candidatus Marinimicrobia bacterium]|nr:hypothetical protein [Candidatus Neomarinimicrobiota bacterium]|tara:strand:+ start:450 stop:1208 length:759 start_codon:yes stop_codon:yes gene_type:complete